MLGWLELGLARLQMNITIAEALEEPITAEATHEHSPHGMGGSISQTMPWRVSGA